MKKDCFLCLTEIEEDERLTPIENIISCDCKIFIHRECFEKYIEKYNNCPYCHKQITYFKYLPNNELPSIISINNNDNQQLLENQIVVRQRYNKTIVYFILFSF